MNALKFEITMILLLVCLTVFAFALPGCESMTARSITVQQSDPVTGEAINTNISTQYQGQTVYFSSEENKNTFLKDPSAYVDKLPQFKQMYERKTGILKGPEHASGDNW